MHEFTVDLRSSDPDLAFLPYLTCRIGDHISSHPTLWPLHVPSVHMLCGFLLCFSDHIFVSLQAFLYTVFSDVSCRIFCQFLNDSFLFFAAFCASSDHYQVSRSFRFWSLVTPQTLFAASTMLYFNVSQVTFWLFIFFLHFASELCQIFTFQFPPSDTWLLLCPVSCVSILYSHVHH